MPLLVTDIVVFRRLPNGELKFPLEGATGLEAVAIGCRSRLQLCRGEWFLNLRKGLPLLPTSREVGEDIVPEGEAILGNPFNPIRVRQAILSELLTVPGVTDVPVLKMTFDGSARNLRVAWSARCRFGDTPVDSLSIALPSI